MRYATVVTIDPQLDGTKVRWHIFRANSIHDPDFTGVGHQPYGHDAINILYNSYTVLKSRISATFASDTAIHTGMGYMRIDDNATSLAVVDSQYAAEVRGVGTRVIGHTNSAKGIQTMTFKYNKNRFWKGRADDNAHQSTPFGENPTAGAYFYVGYAQPFNTGAGPIQPVRILVEYLVRVSDVPVLIQS